MVPYRLSTDAQIINKLSVETLGLGLVKVMFSEQLERLNLNFNKPFVKSP